MSGRGRVHQTWQRNGDHSSSTQQQQSQQGGGGGSWDRSSNSSSTNGRTAGQQQPQQSRSDPPTRSSSARGFRRGATWREANANGPPRRMEVAIPQKNLKLFAGAVQCLMKIGKELFIEATADQLVLRTLNDAKSAFSAFYFNDGGFFETFRCSTARATQELGSFDSQGSAASGGGGKGSVSCKVLVRAVHNILRTLKKVVRLVIYVEGEDDAHIEPHLVFQMYCEFGYRKVHRFSLQDCEIMHAMFDGHGASRLSCPPVQVSQLLEHIHGTAEVAMGASHDVLTVRSYHHPLTGAADRAVLKTEMSISTAEFDTYRFCGAEDEEVELVFSLKEIKALLHFTETTEAQTLEMLFKEGGDPLLFQSRSKTFAAELIMATMEPKIIRKEPAPPPPAAEGKSEPEATQATQHSDKGADASSQGGQEFVGRQGPLDRWAREEEENGGPREDRTAGNREESGRGGERDVADKSDGGDHRRRRAAQDGDRGGHSEPTRAPAPQDHQRFEDEPFGDATKERRGLKPYADDREWRSNARRQPGIEDGGHRTHGRRRPAPGTSADRGCNPRASHRYDDDDEAGRWGSAVDSVDDGRPFTHNNVGHNEGVRGGEAGSWHKGASGESHTDEDGNGMEEPHSEMPTQFPGLRAAYDSAGVGFGAPLEGVSGVGSDDMDSSLGERGGMGVVSNRRRYEDDDEGPVHAGKRRRRVVGEEDD